MSNPQATRMYTIAEAGHMMDFSKSTMYKLIRLGLIKSIGTGRNRRILHTELLAYQERNRNPPRGQA